MRLCPQTLLVDGDGNLDSACYADAAALADTPHDRPTIDVTNATDAALGGAIGHLGKNRQRLPNRLGIVSSASLRPVRDDWSKAGSRASR